MDSVRAAVSVPGEERHSSVPGIDTLLLVPAVAATGLSVLYTPQLHKHQNLNQEQNLKLSTRQLGR